MSSPQKMKYLIQLCFLIAVVSCDRAPTEVGEDKKFPSELEGEWVFDEESATAAIEKMPIKEEDKLKLQSSYIGMIRGESRHMDSTGRITGDTYPDELIIRLHVVEKRADGVVTRTTNSMNPTAKQFTLNTVVDGVWRSRILDDSFNPVDNMPADYWKRPREKSAETESRRGQAVEQSSDIIVARILQTTPVGHGADGVKVSFKIQSMRHLKGSKPFSEVWIPYSVLKNQVNFGTDYETCMKKNDERILFIGNGTLLRAESLDQESKIVKEVQRDPAPNP
jgi:hypothetical protein